MMLEVGQYPWRPVKMIGVSGRLALLLLIVVVLHQASSYPFDSDVYFELDDEVPGEFVKRNTLSDVLRILKARGKGRWDDSKTHIFRFGAGK